MNNTKLLVAFSIFIVIVGLGFLFLGLHKTNSNLIQKEATSSGILVTKVLDGDTIEIEGGQRVRYLGIDTPETVDPKRPVGCFGKEASNKNKELVEGKKVILESDIEDQDKYGRLLRYVYLPLEKGEMLFVQDDLIREGFGKLLIIPPDNKYEDRLRQAQNEARENLRGLWGSC